MTYTRKNLLLTILEVQALVLEYQGKGKTQQWIHKNIIHPKYFISISTYYNYLKINARKELKEYEQKQKPK
ncbi:MAG: hypothetical protein ACOYN4_08920 [Bacteroidales bacterium]